MIFIKYVCLVSILPLLLAEWFNLLIRIINFLLFFALTLDLYLHFAWFFHEVVLGFGIDAIFWLIEAYLAFSVFLSLYVYLVDLHLVNGGELVVLGVCALGDWLNPLVFEWSFIDWGICYAPDILLGLFFFWIHHFLFIFKIIIFSLRSNSLVFLLKIHIGRMVNFLQIFKVNFINTFNYLFLSLSFKEGLILFLQLPFLNWLDIVELFEIFLLSTVFSIVEDELGIVLI